jgi:alpha-tubulin suppressor-like RCC1 family protein
MMITLLSRYSLITTFLCFFTTSVSAIAPQLVAGANHSVALRADGTVWAWGNNELSQLGDGTTTAHPTPVQVTGLPSIVLLASAVGANHTLALATDGTLWAWGYNADCQLGDGTTTDRHTPVQITGLPEIIMMSATQNSSMALDRDGVVWFWGATSVNACTLETVTDEDTHAYIHLVGDRSDGLGLQADGAVWAWGSNEYGQLGTGSPMPEESQTPVQVESLQNVQSVALGTSHRMALTRDGLLWGWGFNSDGQLGFGTMGSNQFTPVQVSNLTSITAIRLGHLQSLALRMDGTVWAWGNNWYGQLGFSGDHQPTPVHVSQLHDIFGIAAGTYHHLAMQRDGTVWAWGNTDNGTLGDVAATVQSAEPVQVALNDIFAGWNQTRDTAWRVAEIYLATMGYAPDHEGLQYWVEEIETQAAWTPETVAQSFFDQDLVQERYPATQAYGEFIEALYRNIFGRAPDQNGYDYWLNELQTGAASRDSMVMRLINGGWDNVDAHADMARFANRVMVGLEFAAQQEGAYSQLSPSAQQAIRTAGANVIRSVSADPVSRAIAIASIPYELN